MPYLRVETNVESVPDMDACIAHLSEAVAKSLGKPQSYVSVAVVPGVRMVMGEPRDFNKPCAQVVMFSIGKLSVEENKKHSAVLAAVIKKQLGVESDRCYIFFRLMEASNVGYSGTTFHTILGR